MAVKRYATVQGADSERMVEAYLPDNYKLVTELPLPSGWMLMAYMPKPWFLIEGEDVAGWTMDDYVIPRFASGNIRAVEITEARAYHFMEAR